MEKKKVQVTSFILDNDYKINETINKKGSKLLVSDIELKGYTKLEKPIRVNEAVIDKCFIKIEEAINLDSLTDSLRRSEIISVLVRSKKEMDTAIAYLRNSYVDTTDSQYYRFTVGKNDSYITVPKSFIINFNFEDRYIIIETKFNSFIIEIK